MLGVLLLEATEEVKIGVFALVQLLDEAMLDCECVAFSCVCRG